MTRLGYFLKVLVANCITKVDQIFGNFVGYFEIHNFTSKTNKPTSRAIFREN